MSSQTSRTRTLFTCCSFLMVASPASAGFLLTGPDAGTVPQVKLHFIVPPPLTLSDFFAYTPTFTGGVRVALGDVNADGLPDIITGTGAGGPAHVKVFNAPSPVESASFFAYSPSFTGGVYVASGDVTGDGRADIITGTGAGTAGHVKVLDGTKLTQVAPDGTTLAETASFFAYSPTFTGGVRVAAGDVNGDGRADIITGAGSGAGGHVKVFDGVSGSEIRSFFAYAPTFSGGVFVASGDINGDGRAEIITGAGEGAAGGHVKVFDGVTNSELQSFLAFPGFTGGVRVGAGDLDGDRLADLIVGTGPAAASPIAQVRAFKGTNLFELANFSPYSPAPVNGLFVAGFNPAIPEPGSAALLILTLPLLTRRRPRK